MKPSTQRIGLIALIALCVFGVVWSARAALGQMLYYHVRHGHAAFMGLDESTPMAQTIPRRLEIAENARRCYPWNFRLCRAAADVSYDALWDRKHIDHGVVLDDVRRWCDRGLALNPRSRRLNYIDAEIVAETSPSDALTQWQDYMDGHFWDTFNHYYVVELLARSGRFSDAFQHLHWLKDRKHEDNARMLIRYEWEEQERQMRAYLQERSRL